jgi:hypothetical protein
LGAPHFGRCRAAQHDRPVLPQRPAKGLAKALGDLAAHRRDESQRPALEQGLDLFHTVLQAHKLLRPLWRKAEAAWKRAEAADEALRRARCQGQNAQQATHQMRWAWTKAEWALAVADQTQRSWTLARSAFEVFDERGNLNTRSRAEAILAEAVAGLPAVGWKRVINALLDRRGLAFLDRLHGQLAAIEPRAQWRAAWAWRWWLSQAGRGGRSGVGSVVRLVGRDGPLSESEAEVFGRVATVLCRVCRASSAVECLNGVLRKQQGQHRRMTQGMLDLKRLFWNCQRSGTGARRGTSPYQRLRLALPTSDFWKLLQTSPEQLMQELSSPKVAP